MTGHIKLSLGALLMAALFLMTGCSDGPEAVKQPETLTKQDVKEAIEEASRPGQFTKDAVEAYEANRDKVREQMKGYSPEDQERKKIEAQKAYEEFKRQQELKKGKKTE